MRIDFVCLKSTSYIVNGLRRSMIIDIDKNHFFYIPNFITDVFEKRYINLSSVIYDKKVYPWVSLLIENNFCFVTKNRELFKNNLRKFDSPYLISSVVLELSEMTKCYIVSLEKDISSLNCPALQIRLLAGVKLESVLNELEFLNSSSFIYIELLIDASVNEIRPICDILHKFDKIKKVLFYDSRLLNKVFKKYHFEVLFSKFNLDESKKSINLLNFETNISLFSEAQTFNIGLNGKVYIDKDGNIKNYGSHSSIYGNVKDSRLKEIVQSKEFQLKWHISNDKIEICKICEYRYICLDNTDLEIKDNLIYKTEECNYNPKTTKWKN